MGQSEIWTNILSTKTRVHFPSVAFVVVVVVGELGVSIGEQLRPIHHHCIVPTGTNTHNRAVSNSLSSPIEIINRVKYCGEGVGRGLLIKASVSPAGHR